MPESENLESKLGTLKIVDIDLNRVTIRVEPKVDNYRKFVVFERDLARICDGERDNYKIGDEMRFYIEKLRELVKERTGRQTY
ncbi:hypothetical protein D6817_05340 [Candidatus Pacearchaeota archaeon]|nr:MAG: hypothetical protein D6817_05340 [Candidatus Pacearchaeota archaeon]